MSEQTVDRIGSALAERLADKLMTNPRGQKARRISMRGTSDEDLGGFCREIVVRIIDEELDAAALERARPALMREIRRILEIKE